jgi:hypothetical protein
VEPDQFDESMRRMESVHAALQQQTQTLQQQSIEIDYRSRERAALLERLSAAEYEYQQQLEQLGSDDREDLEHQRKVAALKDELSKLEEDIGELDEPAGETELLQHLPTPMAKTVFGEEVHLMLQAGQVSVVPWDELVRRLKEEANRVVQGQSGNRSIEQTLGPVNGFLMNYKLNARSGMVSNGGGASLARVVQLDRFELDPTEAVIRETVDAALQPSGRVRSELAARNPNETVVTVWVYPDSFEEFRKLKEALYSGGFLTAARPIPEHVRIGASPNGSKSSAQ